MLTKNDLKKIRDIVEVVLDEKFNEKLDEKLGRDFAAKINRIENNTDMACKIAKDTREELAILDARVDRHDREIKELQSFTGLATA